MPNLPREIHLSSRPPTSDRRYPLSSSEKTGRNSLRPAASQCPINPNMSGSCLIGMKPIMMKAAESKSDSASLDTRSADSLSTLLSSRIRAFISARNAALQSSTDLSGSLVIHSLFAYGHPVHHIVDLGHICLAPTMQRLSEKSIYNISISRHPNNTIRRVCSAILDQDHVQSFNGNEFTLNRKVTHSYSNCSAKSPPPYAQCAK